MSTRGQRAGGAGWGRAPRAIARRVLPAPGRRILRRGLRRLSPASSRTSSDGLRTVRFALPTRPGDTGPPRHAVLRAPATAFIPKRLADTGLAGYEPEALACYLAAVELLPPGAVLDIGANVGIYGLLARAVGREVVHGFEPVPDIAAVARRCAADNGLDYPVFAAALGREPGVATLYLSQVTDTSNSLNPRFRPSAQRLDVPVSTVDAHVREHALAPVLLKVDTETTEPDVLAGAEEVIAEHRPWLLVEVLPRRVERALAEVVRPWGYTWYHCSGAVPFPARPSFDHALEDERALMWLLTPRPCPPAFWQRAAEWGASLAACVPGAAAART